MKKPWLALVVLGTVGFGLVLAQSDLGDLAAKAKTEGKIVSYGIPNDWLNYEKMWGVFTKRYGVTNADTDMSSAEEIAKFLAEKNAPVADVGDVGLAFGPIGTEQGAFMPYKNKFWNEIPDWAKGADGHYAAAYYGTVSFIVNPKLVKKVPVTWKELLRPEYKGKIGLSDPRKAAVAQYAVIAAAYAFGGSEKNLKPGLDFFAKLQKSGNLTAATPSLANMQKGEVAVGINWDYNGLSFKRTLGTEVPLDVTSAPNRPLVRRRRRRGKLWVRRSVWRRASYPRAGRRFCRRARSSPGGG